MRTGAGDTRPAAWTLKSAAPIGQRVPEHRPPTGAPRQGWPQVSPGVVMAKAPWATPYRNASSLPSPLRKGLPSNSTPAERAVLTSLVSRGRWGVFLVTPATLVRWHGDLVARSLDVAEARPSLP